MTLLVTTKLEPLLLFARIWKEPRSLGGRNLGCLAFPRLVARIFSIKVMETEQAKMEQDWHQKVVIEVHGAGASVEEGSNRA